MGNLWRGQLLQPGHLLLSLLWVNHPNGLNPMVGHRLLLPGPRGTLILVLLLLHQLLFLPVDPCPPIKCQKQFLVCLLPLLLTFCSKIKLISLTQACTREYNIHQYYATIRKQPFIIVI